MNVGKTLFAQVMEFVPWKTFGRIIERHQGAFFVTRPRQAWMRGACTRPPRTGPAA